MSVKLSTMFRMLSAPVKYIELGGSALGYPEPFKTLIRPSFLSAVTAVAGFSLLAADAPTQVKIYIAEHALIGYGTARGIRRVLYDLQLAHRYGDTVITTQPTEEQIINSVKHRQNAAKTARTETVGLAMSATFLATTMIKGNGIDLSPVLLFAPVITEHMSARFRFARVADGRYAIVDRPPVKDALAHLEPPVKQRETSALPAPA